MNRFRQYMRDASLVNAAAAYLFLAILGSLACSLFIRNLSKVWMLVILEREAEKGSLYRAVSYIYYGTPFLVGIAAVFFAVRCYVEYKIKPAVTQIQMSISHIMAGDLEYEIAYASRDELGDLCRKIESLRRKMQEEKKNEWQAGEEQRKINAAFAHDMRTPLTVIKGYTEFLRKFIPQGKVSQESLLEKLEAIAYQEERLYAFSKTMTRLQQMEKWEVCCTWTDMENVQARLKEIAEGMRTECLPLVIETKEQQTRRVLVDLELVLEAVENAVSNAIRYAKTRVEIYTECRGSRMEIYVRDDGEGFSPRALREASRVYFSEEKEEGQEHFGIGLTITKLLCEKHGGDLTLVNGIEGGAIAGLSFYVGEG